MAETNFTKQIHSKENKDYHPKGDKYFTVENPPAVCEVSNREEFKRKCKFKEA